MPRLRLLIILLVLFNLLALAAWRGWLGEGDTRGEPERITNQLRPERIKLLSQAELAADAATSVDAAPAELTAPAAPPEPAPKAKPAAPPRPAASPPPAPVVQADVPTPERPAQAAEPIASEPPAAKAEEPAAPEPEAAKAVGAPAPPAAQAPAEVDAPPREVPPREAATRDAPTSDEVPVAAAPPACVAFAGLGEDAAGPLIADAKARRDFETRDIVSTEVDSWWVMLPSLGGMAAAQKRSAELRALGINEQYIIPERGSHPYGISLGLFRSAESAEEQRRELTAKGVDNIKIEARGITVHRVEVRGPSDRLSEWASSWTSRQPRGSRLSCRP